MFKMMIAALPLLLVCGCAASQAGLANDKLIESFHSAKPAGVVAGCVQQNLRANPSLGTDGTNYWVTRQNGYGMPVVRYDFKPDANGGSTVEYRSRLRINNGLGKVKHCAGVE